MNKLSNQEINDLILMAGERAGRCLLDALQLVDDPEQRARVIFQVDAMLLAMGACLLQKFAKAEGEAVEWNRCLLAVSHMAKEKALAMKPDQRGE